MIRPTYTDEDGWTFPAWWPKLARNVVETWTSAKHSGDADLTYRQWRDHDQWNVRLITYLTPDTLGLGVSVDRERRWPRGAGASDGGWFMLTAHVGFVMVTLAVHQRDIAAPRRLSRTS